jgi:hypothetical protein
MILKVAKTTKVREKENIVISSQGSIHNGSLLLSQLNTQLLITVHNSSRILTLVWQILELQQLRVMSSGF